MIDHIGIVVNDYAASKKFYEPVLAAIGAKMIMEFPEGTHGQSVSGWGREQQPTFWFSNCPDGTKPSPVHVALSCADRPSVDAFHEAALKHGATCDGKPGLRPHYHPNYYAAYIIDPSGHKIEAVCHIPKA